MDGLKESLKSKKFWSALIGSALVAAVGYLMPDNPNVFEIQILIGSIFGVQVTAQAHADANQDDYGKKYDK